MSRKITKQEGRIRRHARVRAKVVGTAQRPRLSVFRSLLHVSIQLIDDEAGKTLVGVHSKTQDVSKVDVGERKGKVAVAYATGKILAEKAKAQGVESIVFDRGGFAYQGRVQAVAEGARDGGLQF